MLVAVRATVQSCQKVRKSDRAKPQEGAFDRRHRHHRGTHPQSRARVDRAKPLVSR